MIFLALLLSLACGRVSVHLLDDGGTGWHIRSGQQILTSHAVPRVDSFSSTMSGQTWYAWEWLFDAGMGAVYNAAGLNGVVFTTALLIALSFFLVFRFLESRSAGLAAPCVFLILAVLASSVHFLARPHVVSWLLTIAWFAVLDSHDEASRESKTLPLWWLPLLMLLWVNLHGGFVLGFMLLGIYLLAAVVERLRAADPGAAKSSGRRLRRLALATLGCVFSSLINPYGYRLHIHIYDYLTNRFLMDHIEEFQSPNFHAAAGKAFVLLLVLSGFALATGRKHVRVAPALVALFAAVAGLYAARNLPVSSFLLCMTAAPLLSQWTRDQLAVAGASGGNPAAHLHGFSQRMSALNARLRAHAWPLLAVIVGAWACGQQGRLGPWQVINAHFDDTRFPVQAATVLADRKTPEPVLSTDAWGGYLIYRLYPQSKVVVDDRHDLYGESFMRDYLKVVHAQPGWDAVLDRWAVHWAVMPPQSTLASVLKERPAWRIEHDDGRAIIFHRQ